MKVWSGWIAFALLLGCGASDAPIADAAEYAGDYRVIVEPGPADKRPALIGIVMNSGQKLHLKIEKDGRYVVTKKLDGTESDRGVIVKRGEGFGFKSDSKMDVAEEVTSFTVVSETVMVKVKEGRYLWTASTSDRILIVKE